MRICRIYRAGNLIEMCKIRKIEKALKLIAIILFMTAPILFFCSFSARDNLQRIIGYASLGLIPCGILSLTLGIIFEKKRSKRWILGAALCAVGGVLIAFSPLLLAVVFVALLAGAKLTLEINLLLCAFYAGLVFIIIGYYICKKSNYK